MKSSLDNCYQKNTNDDGLGYIEKQMAGCFWLDAIREIRKGETGKQCPGATQTHFACWGESPTPKISTTSWLRITLDTTKPPVMMEWIPSGIILGLRMDKAEENLVVSMEIGRAHV